MEIERKAFLEVLEKVRPGLSPDATIEQSDCFVFQNGKAYTFDDEIACSCDCKVEFEGAVKAKPFLELLQKLPDEVLKVEVAENELIVRGNRRKSGIRMEHEILLAVNEIEWPGKGDWTKLPDDFNEAAEVVRQCVSKEEGAFALTCVHVHPKFLESCDNSQACRYPLRTGFSNPVLIRSRAILHVGSLSVTEVSVGESWVHFRNDSGLIISCRKYSEDFPDLSEILKTNGSQVQLPEGLEAAAEMARIFSRDNVENDSVEIQLVGNKLKLRGEGPQGWHTETKSIEYSGPDLAFRISPNLLKSVLARSRECILARTRLWIDAGKFMYVTALLARTEET
mgnify:CR=1 FL=1